MSSTANSRGNLGRQETRPVIQEVDDSDAAPYSTTEAFIEEPDGRGGYHPPQYGGSSQRLPPTQDRSFFRQSLFDDPFFAQPSFFSRPSFFGGFLGRPDLFDVGFEAGQPQRSMGGRGAFSYSCSSFTSVGSFGGPRVEHSFVVDGASDGRQQLKETVTDGRTGETRVLRQESNLPGNRPRNPHRINDH